MLAAIFVCAACGRASTPPKCAVDAMLAEPVELDLDVLDLLHPRSCDGEKDRVVRVRIDEQPWCEVAIDCTMAFQAPPRAFACKGPKLKAGAHRVGVELADDPSSLMLRTMSLPAFDVQNGLIYGAHVRVWVSEDRILIDPPMALPVMML